VLQPGQHGEENSEHKQNNQGDFDKHVCIRPLQFDATGSTRTTRSAQQNAVNLARQHVLLEMGQLDASPTDQAVAIGQNAQPLDIKCLVPPRFRALRQEFHTPSFEELSVNESALEMLNCLSFKVKV